VPFLGPDNGESSGDGAGGFYSFLGLIKNVRGDGKIKSAAENGFMLLA